MRGEAITSLLGLQGWSVETMTAPGPGEVRLRLQRHLPLHSRGRCGTRTASHYDQWLRQLRDLPALGRAVYLIVPQLPGGDERGPEPVRPWAGANAELRAVPGAVVRVECRYLRQRAAAHELGAVRRICLDKVAYRARPTGPTKGASKASAGCCCGAKETCP